MYSDRNTTCNYMAGHGDNNSFCSIGGGGRDREHMFDKVVTPSDVGKLNRLVIPKQHAEKYFPLDSSTNEKGLILNFEDRNGKPWRFRYSYWNSSQSYVMTKGWSRFVKEKKLDAGDIVSFERGVGELGKDCLYIDFRRRVDTLDPSSLTPLTHPLAFSRLFVPRPGLLMHRNFDYSNYSGTYGYNAMNHGPVFYLNSLGSQPVGVVEQGGDLNMVQPMVFDSVPVVQCKVAPKRVRLFGVNLDCPMDEDSDLEVLSSPPMTVTNTSFSPHAQIESSRRTEGSLSLELNM